MANGTTLFQLRSDRGQAYDGSSRGVAILGARNATPLRGDTGFRLDKGVMELARNPALDTLQTFTIEATITPELIAGDRRNIIEGQSPAVALFIEPAGKLVGSVHTAAGWVGVDSGATLLKPKTAARVRMMRHADGRTELQINDVTVGSKVIAGPIVNVGAAGFKIGAWVDSQRFPFVGSIGDVDIRRGVETPQTRIELASKAQKIAAEFKRKTGMSRVLVSLIPDEGRARLQPIRDIMNAAGVSKLSDLATLQLTQPMTMTPGKIVVAPRRTGAIRIDWSKIAATMKGATATNKRQTLATLLTNRNSGTVLRGLTAMPRGLDDGGEGDDPTQPPPTGRDPFETDPAVSGIGTGRPPVPSSPSGGGHGGGGGSAMVSAVGATATATAGEAFATSSASRDTPHVVLPMPSVLSAGIITASGRIPTLGDRLATGARLPVELRRLSPSLRRQMEIPTLPELFINRGGRLRLGDPTLPDALQKANPALWPSSGEPAIKTMALTTIPVGSAVIIAHTLDLTNTELRIEPSVTKLYIIAEEIICGANAKITWRRPGGTTPGRADDPDLNGRGWSGVQTRPDSRDGLSGEDGRNGQRGIDGSRGVDAPELEVWTKKMTAIPTLDLNGEDGRGGGRGQRGGNGGNGANGALGERVWFFGWHCTARPGHGGHGGDGGDGGGGGRGGDGGGGGNITIGVLEGTLATTVTSKSFKIKDQGGQRGAGGPGGAGGAGGRGGRAGIGETCKDAQHGRDGAQGQPGGQGGIGVNAGVDGEIRLFEFSEDAWDELLTRPWITELSPTDAFPGDTLTIRGSKFVSGDRVILDARVLTPTFNPDESVSVTIPMNIGGGLKSVVVRRPDGTESNRLNVGIKPRLATLPALLPPNSVVTVTGNAFLAGASALLDGSAIPAEVLNETSLRFTMPGTGGAGSTGGSVTVQVRNPDGRVSNARSVSKPRILEIPFRYGVHNLSFDNFKDGVPDWETFEDTFGTAEVWHELLDPVFGHPVLTGAYYAFYQHFLKGETNGGLATGFCTSLASLVADKFWKGETDATTLTKASLHKFLTGVHGKLLSRESLLHFHDQGREGVARVERSAREIEATFMRGCDRQNAPLLFFIPSGAAWDEGYFDRLSDSHCIMPYRFVYPDGHAGPVLSPDGSTTLSSLDGVQMFCWDCNEPTNPDCRLVFTNSGGTLNFEYFPGGSTVKFSSADGITLGMMSNGSYMLADHDLPFGGPFGLTTFVIDFLLSPAELQVTDGLGLRAGNFGGQILSEIPDSHPCYLVPKAYMLPAEQPLTRRIIGTAAGTYAYNSIAPGGASIVLENVPTTAGQEDTLAMNADGTQIRFTPGGAKTFSLTIARQVGTQARAIALSGVTGAPGEEVDITLSPELSLVRIGNRGVAESLEVRAFSIDRQTNRPLNRKFTGVAVPSQHDLVVAVPDWETLDVSVEALSFE